MDLDDVAGLALALPGVEEAEFYRGRSWKVGGKPFAWERGFSKADLKRFGDETPPGGPIAAVRTAGLAEKEALLATSSPAVFTIPHFDGYAAVLIELDAVGPRELEEILVDGWTAMAPKELIEEHERGR
jgi:hypothetical protein